MTYEEESNRKFPSSEKLIEKYRSEYASYSRSRLIAERHKINPNPPTEVALECQAKAIAVDQLLAEMDKKESACKFWISIIIGLLTLLFAFLTYRQATNPIHTEPKEKPKIEDQNIKKEQQGTQSNLKSRDFLPQTPNNPSQVKKNNTKVK